jgi:hypothetical protein
VPRIAFLATDNAQYDEMREVAARVCDDPRVSCDVLRISNAAEFIGPNRLAEGGASVVIVRSPVIAAPLSTESGLFVVIAPLEGDVSQAVALVGVATIKSGSLEEAFAFSLRVLSIGGSYQLD